MLQRAATQSSAGHTPALAEPETTSPVITGEPQRFDAFDGLFKLMLPPGWQMIHRNDRANAYTGWAPAQNKASFSLTVWPSDAGVTPRTLLRHRRTGMDVVFKDIRIVEDALDVPLGPLKGARMIVEGTDKDGNRLRIVALVAKDDRWTIDFSFFAPAPGLESLRPALDALLQSFELTGTVVESANGKFSVMLPADVKLVQDPNHPDRQHCRLDPDAELVFDVYHASAAYNAASLMALNRNQLAAKYPDYHVLQERKAPPSDIIPALVNGHMLVDEWSKPDGSRWRSGSYYYDDGNFIYTFTLYAKIATFMSLWPTTAQRIAASYHDTELTAAGTQSGTRTITAASGDFEVVIPESWVLDPATAEHVPHRFYRYRSCETAGMGSYPTRAGADSTEQVLDMITRGIGRTAQEFTLVGDSDGKLGALGARERLVEFTLEDIRYRTLILCSVTDGRVYEFWFRTPAERYPFVRPTLDKVLASFTVLPPIDLTKTIPYENKQHHFRFSYPDALHPVGTFGGEVVRVAVRPAGPAVQYLENVVVDPPNGVKDATLTLEKAAANWESSQMRFLAGPKPKGWEDTTVGGVKAKRIVYDMTVKGLDGGPVQIRKMVYVIVRDGRSSSIRVQGRVAAFPVFFGIAQKVIDTFEWTADE